MYLTVQLGPNAPKVFHDVSWINPTEAELRVPFQFVPPQPEDQGPDYAPMVPKPKSKAAPRQLTMSAFWSMEQIFNVMRMG